MAKDPVCKMEIKPDEAEAEATYRGDKYYFCSDECKESFEKKPERYVEQQKQRKAG